MKNRTHRFLCGRNAAPPILLVMLAAGCLYAQPDCLRTQVHGIESPSQSHEIVWVCSGDTLTVDTNSNGEVITTVDGFWITCSEVTRDIWRWYYMMDAKASADDNLPITGISQEEFDKFIDVFNKSYHQTWRLPTRDEWLFAFRGGLFGGDYAFSGSNRPDFVAWSKSNSDGKLHPVGERIANDLGIYDLSGNAAEMATDGDSIVYLGGCYLDSLCETQITENGERRTENGERRAENVDYSIPPTEARGFRLVCHEPLKFTSNCERVFY